MTCQRVRAGVRGSVCCNVCCSIKDKRRTQTCPQGTKGRRNQLQHTLQHTLLKDKRRTKTCPRGTTGRRNQLVLGTLLYNCMPCVALVCVWMRIHTRVYNIRVNVGVNTSHSQDSN